MSAFLFVACETHECTEIGCADGWSLTLVEAGGGPPAHTLEGAVDGVSFVCPAVSLDTRHVTCGASITLELVDPATGRFEEILVVRDTPKAVTVTVRHSGGGESEETFEPDYVTSQPNGPECSPTCRQASDHWDLP